MRQLVIILIFTSLLSCQNHNEQKLMNDSMDAKQNIQMRFQEIIDSVYSSYPKTKGISIHIESPDHNISWTGSVGWADSAAQRKLLPEDPALIASNTKTYVAASILRLVEEDLISIEQSIDELITPKTDSLLISGGYDTKAIKVKHLLSQTSGLNEYTRSSTYLNKTINEPDYQWTRWEQMVLTINDLRPLSQPGQSFSYSELNSLLMGEMLEVQTGLPFYSAMRKLLRFEKFDIHNTWFYTLEDYPVNLNPLVHQFATDYKVDSYTLNPSFDLYGGGGLAATPKDVSKFTQYLFEGKLFNKPETSQLLFTEIPTSDGLPCEYYFGITKFNLGDYTCYGHGGFWGTTAQYFSELNASVSVFLMERDEWPRYKIILEKVAIELEKQKSQ